MTQEYVASNMSTVDGIRWDRRTVAAIEEGRRRLTVDEVYVLAVVLGAPLAELAPELASSA